MSGVKPEVRRRIDDLILYTRYVELYHAQADAGGKGQAAARDAMVAFAYRMRTAMLVHAYGIWARTVGQKAAADPAHPLKNDAPFTEAEIGELLERGIAANQPEELNFTPVAFSEDLVPAATALGLTDGEPGAYPPVPQDRQTWYLWVAQAPAEIPLKVTVKKVWALRPHHITLHSPLAPGVEPVDESRAVQPDGKTYDVVLKTPHAGLHRLDIRDGGDYTRVEFPADMPVTLVSGVDSPGIGNHFRGAWTLVFYVPKGTAMVGGWAGRIAAWAPRVSGVLRDGSGAVVHDFSQTSEGWFQVPVPPGQDGQVWRFEKSQGTRQLMTVPPCLARKASELLLPREVVERDGSRAGQPAK